MLSKLGIVEEEADECQFWLESAVDCGFVESASIKELHHEYDQIVAMMVGSRRTLKKRIRTSGNVVRESRRGRPEESIDKD